MLCGVGKVLFWQFKLPGLFIYEALDILYAPHSITWWKLCSGVNICMTTHPLLVFLTDLLCLKGDEQLLWSLMSPGLGEKSPEEAPVGMEGRHRSCFHTGRLGESVARGHCSASHLQGVAPWRAPWQCSVLRWGMGGSVSLLMCHDLCPWAWQPGSQPSQSPATFDYYWVHCPRGRHTTQLSKQPAKLLEIPFTVCFCI